jgi:hypothetical protein
MTDELEQYEPEFQIGDPGDEHQEEVETEVQPPQSFDPAPLVAELQALRAEMAQLKGAKQETVNEETPDNDGFDYESDRKVYERAKNDAKREVLQELSPYLQQVGQMTVGSMTSDEHEKAYIEGWCKENNIDPQQLAMTPALAKLAKDAAKGHKLSQKRAPGYEAPDMDREDPVTAEDRKLMAAFGDIGFDPKEFRRRVGGGS